MYKSAVFKLLNANTADQKQQISDKGDIVQHYIT